MNINGCCAGCPSLWCNCSAECLRATEFIQYKIKHKDQPHPLCVLACFWQEKVKSTFSVLKNKTKKTPEISTCSAIWKRWLYNSSGCGFYTRVSIQDRTTASFLHLIWPSLSLWSSAHNTYSYTQLMSSISIHIWQTVIHLCNIQPQNCSGYRPINLHIPTCTVPVQYFSTFRPT